MNPRRSFLFAFLLCLASATAAERNPMRSLAGTWRFQLDRSDLGIGERWFARDLPKRVQLPGSLPAQGIGDPVSVDTKWMGGIVDQSWFTAPEYAPYRQPGHVKIPFWLQPDTYYAGVAWYQREIEIPGEWVNKRVVLTLERPHWATHVWLDERDLGACDSLSTSHEYELGTGLRLGRHRLTIRVENRLIVDIGINSHSISDHTQGNWNGIVGELSLKATPAVYLDDLQLYPGAKDGEVTCVARLGNATDTPGTGNLLVSYLNSSITAHRGTGNPQRLAQVPVSWSATGALVKLAFELPAHAREAWDEFNPQLHPLNFELSTGDSKTINYGFRKLATQGTQFTINGRPTFIRGTLECCIFPKTGHPPTDVDSWKRILRIARSYGLNLLRFHSWCPPEAAFVAADELGFYYQVEIASWANQSTSLGDGKPVDQWLYREAERILKTYGNHPSFLLMPYGNEPGGRNASAYLAQWVDHWKAADPRRLYTSGSGWPQLPENDFHVTPDPRIQAWGAGLKSRINAKPPETCTDYRDYISKRSVPIISHEIGQWCVYPNFDEIPKYTGYLKPKNFEIFRDSLKAHHMRGLAHEFLLASGKLQVLCYKEEIESALRTPGMGGFELLDLHDFPGQGTALVGVLDPFWQEKGYVTAAEYSRFCNRTVPLARLAKRVFTTDERLTADLEVAHFGSAPIKGAQIHWCLVNERGRVVAGANLFSKEILLGNGTPLGHIEYTLKELAAPAKYRLVVSIKPPEPKAIAFENDWDIWVYPAKVDTSVPTGITVASSLDSATVSALDAGGKVLLLIPPTRVKGDGHGKVALGFSSIFWNTAWTGRQPPHTLGILCDPKNPALADFPAEYHSNWQWWYLVSQGGAMILDDLPPQLRPTVQVIDDWVTNRKLALIFEARVGFGKLMVCSIDLRHDDNPVSRQMLHSLLRYISGPHFNPSIAVSAEQIKSLMSGSAAPPHGMRVLKTDSQQPGYEADNVLDADPQTLWHTTWDEPAPGFPHELQFSFETPIVLRGFTALPRQDGNRNGWIKDYEVYRSSDGKNWGTPVTTGTFPENSEVKTVMFDRPIETRFLRFVALSGFTSAPWSSLAEFKVLE